MVVAAPVKAFPQPTFLLNPVQATVERGKECDISAEAVPAYGEDVVFKISRYPKFGSLEKSAKSASTQVFHYVNDSKCTSLEDSFEFRVKAPGHTWNTYQAELTIENPTGTLIVLPPKLDFGNVPIGTTAQKQLVLSNSFGAPITGTLLCSRPWRVSPEGAFLLSEGNSQEFIIDFSPTDGTAYSAQVTVTPELTNFPVILLSGRGIVPFVLTSNSATVSSEDTLARFQVANNSESPMTLSWSGDTNLDFSPPATIPPKSMGEVWISTARLKLHEEEQRKYQPVLEAGSYSQSVDLLAVGPKGTLALEVMQGPELVYAKVGHPILLAGILHNNSGTERTCSLAVWDNDKKTNTTASPSKVMTLGAGKSAAFSIPWTPTRTGICSPAVHLLESGNEVGSGAWKFCINPSEVNTPLQNVRPAVPSPLSNYPDADLQPTGSVHLANAQEKEMMAVWLPPRFEEGLFRRSLVLRWYFSGSLTEKFILEEYHERNPLADRTGEEEDPWKKINLKYEPQRVDETGIWEARLPMPYPGSRQFLVVPDGIGSKIAAPMTIGITWGMFAWPFLRILLILAGGVILLKIVRRWNFRRS